MNNHFPIYHYDTLTSTNEFLKENYQSLESFCAVSALYQTSGKGRLNRIWLANRGENVMMSILIKENFSDNFNPALISLLAAMAVHKVLIKKGLDIKIKWPNDLLINDKKICGILTEGVSSSQKIEAIIVGIGINVNQEKFDIDIDKITTSIKKETNKEFDINIIIEEVHKMFIECYKKFIVNRLLPINYLRKFLFKKNSNVNFIKNEKIYTGKILDVNNNGALLLEVDGTIMSVISGEIKIIR